MRIAVITGASSGMGMECAVQLADRYGRYLDEIWLIARRKEKMEALKGQLPVSLRLFPTDITDRIQLERLKMALEEEKPKVLFLVNAPGFGKIGPVGSLPLETEAGMIRLNCRALCTVTHMVLPYMADNGRILQFASSAAFLPQPRFAIYAATKSFVLSYSRALNVELKSRRICVTAVCPGPVKTEFFDTAGAFSQIPLYKRLSMADPVKVVRKAIRDSAAGRSVSVYGPLMKLFSFFAKLLPHSLILKGWEALDMRAAAQNTAPPQE